MHEHRRIMWFDCLDITLVQIQRPQQDLIQYGKYKH